MSNLFSRTHTVNLNLRSTIEPLPRFKIMLTASRRYALNESEYFRNNADSDGDGIADDFGSLIGKVLAQQKQVILIFLF